MSDVGKNNAEAMLRCVPRTLAYDFQNHFGKLTVAEHHNCDMEGCIALFEKIDPDVRVIEVFAGDIPSNLYARLSSGDWTAYRPGKTNEVPSP